MAAVRHFHTTGELEQESTAAEAPATVASVTSVQRAIPSMADAVDSALKALAQFMELVLPVINAFRPKEQACGVGPKPVEIKTEDNSFGAHLAVLENGDLSVSVGSREASLENQPVCIKAGEKRWTATFRKVRIGQQDQVVAELVIKQEDLVALPQGSVLQARLGAGD